jgi:hypothetical protein
MSIAHRIAADYEIKDSGERKVFDSGMQRDTETGKPDYTYVIHGPMLQRWAEHMMKGAGKYDKNNWLLANDREALERYERSAFRHLLQWLRGERDEDHAAAVIFNINGAEYVREQLNEH